MSKKIRKNLNLHIVLTGASGRMGECIQTLAPAAQIITVGQIEKSSDWKQVDESQVDVVVDFSTPQGLRNALAWCMTKRKPLVSGTTGLSALEKRQMLKASQSIPLLYSANMSLGIAVMSNMLQALQGLSDWDFQIEEAHHKHKKDQPSGTALLLQQKLSQVTAKPLPPPHSIRGGSIAGIHQVWAMGPHEAILLQHTAFDRQVFAQGALFAARWLFDKKQPGLYDLTDLYPKN